MVQFQSQEDTNLLVERIKRFFAEYKSPRYRDRRGWNASELCKDARDLYWSATGEKATNPTDLTGNLRMLVGKAVEREITTNVIANLHFFGLHSVAPATEQIQIGGSAPDVNGLLDGLLVERAGETFSKPWVLEIKVKTGYGANLFKNDCDPGKDYLAQMGYYLRDLNGKGVTNRGIFLFVLVSDASFGEMIEVECMYDADTDTVSAYKATHIDGTVKTLAGISLAMGPVLERLKLLNQAVRNEQLPPKEAQYKYELTAEYVSSLSDRDIKAAIDGDKVLGDWQIKYSKFKNLHLQAQGTSLGYTDAERAILIAEYKARHPRSKVA